MLPRTPGQISGGQRQRVSIARALATEPRLLICDEPVSALDASNRNYILRLLEQLRTSLGLSIVIISHDLSSLAGIADRVVVLYRGRIVEDGPVDQVFAAPEHPYTALLMASAPSVRHDRELAPRQLTRTVAEAGALPEDLLAGLGEPGRLRVRLTLRLRGRRLHGPAPARPRPVITAASPATATANG